MPESHIKIIETKKELLVVRKRASKSDFQNEKNWKKKKKLRS